MTQTWDQPELPFEEDLPPAPNDFEMKSLVGCAAIFVVGGVHPDMFTRHGTKAAVRAAIVILNGPDAGQEIIDALLFNTRVVRRLRQAAIGKPYTLHVDEDTQYTQPAVILMDPSEEERQLGRNWHATHPGRAAELGEVMVSAYNVALEADRGNNRQMQQTQQRQEPRRSAPPTGPNYGKEDVKPSNPPAERVLDDEPPF